MFGHDNFSIVQKSWTDFWQGMNKSPLYSITIPKDGRNIVPEPPYLSWFDGAYEETADAVARWYESCEFYGAAIPCFAESFGPDDLASYLGADLIYRPSEDKDGSTSWAVHCLDTLEGADIRFDQNGKWWTKTVKFHETLKKRLGESVMLGTSNICCGGLDGLSALYGPEPLLMDLMDVPELVHRALDQINAAFTQIVRAWQELFEHKRYGSINRFGMYSTGTIDVPQCDFSCMISPALFEEFAVPAITHAFFFMDGGAYHLDGPGALKHLDRLVQIPGLDIIQWVPGTGAALKQDWTSLYQKILASGKGLLLGSSGERAGELLQKLPSKKIFMYVYGIKSRMEAEDFLYKMDKLWEKLVEENKCY